MERISEKELINEFKDFLWVRYTAYFNMNKKAKDKIANGDKKELQKLLGKVYNEIKEEYGIIDSSYLENYLFQIAKYGRGGSYFNKMILDLLNVSDKLRIEKNTIRFIDKNFWDVPLILRAINQLYKLNIELIPLWREYRFCQPSYIKLGKISIRLYKDNKTVKIIKLK